MITYAFAALLASLQSSPRDSLLAEGIRLAPMQPAEALARVEAGPARDSGGSRAHQRAPAAPHPTAPPPAPRRGHRAGLDRAQRHGPAAPHPRGPLPSRFALRAGGTVCAARGPARLRERAPSLLPGPRARQRGADPGRQAASPNGDGDPGPRPEGTRGRLDPRRRPPPAGPLELRGPHSVGVRAVLREELPRRRGVQRGELGRGRAGAGACGGTRLEPDLPPARPGPGLRGPKGAPGGPLPARAYRRAADPVCRGHDVSPGGGGAAREPAEGSAVTGQRCAISRLARRLRFSHPLSARSRTSSRRRRSRRRVTCPAAGANNRAMAAPRTAPATSPTAKPFPVPPDDSTSSSVSSVADSSSSLSSFMGPPGCGIRARNVAAKRGGFNHGFA